VTSVPRLIAITDRRVESAQETLTRFERLARAARPGSLLIQLRDRELSARERLAFGVELKALTLGAEQRFQVNDRLDLALLLGADAVHLGESSVVAGDARRLLGRQCFLTCACHEPEGAVDRDVDGWLVSPIAAERKGRSPLGRGVFREFQARWLAEGSVVRPALYALGGIDAGNARACLDAGATGVAVIGAALTEPDPLPLLRALDILR
jgi:thiamine-phosphate pyrophosphorylase